MDRRNSTYYVDSTGITDLRTGEKVTEAKVTGAGTAAVNKALAAKYLAEAREAELKADSQALYNESRQLMLDQEHYNAQWAAAGNDLNRTARLSGQIDDDFVNGATTYLSRWDRMYPDADLTILLNSPGGYVTDTMELFDFIAELRDRHEVTIKARGMVASGASILFQAASPGRRLIGAECKMLIHKPSGVIGGDIDRLMDEVKMIEAWADRMLKIYVSRAGVKTATKPATAAFLKKNWERKDWTIDSDESVAFGLADEIG